MKSPEAVEKFKRGPIGLLTVIPSGAPAMGKYLGQWFLYCVVVGIFVACLAGRTHACARSSVPASVPRGRHCRLPGIRVRADSRLDLEGQTWGVTAKHIFDGLIYALLTAGTFGWLWPK